MVFESLVTDLLNKYLGQYVQNLDPSQLKIGIWGGNAKLQNLELKDTALDDLNLPIKVVRGHLGKLHLSIPWKNLYNEPTEVEIENLFVLAKPKSDITYDAKKDEEEKLEKKQRQLENIEEARKREEDAKKKGKEKEEPDSFAEKLATQVIKNLQVTIKNIHIRYEDSITTPGFPFSIGVTLDELSALTTDGNFVPKIIKESVTIIHKMVKLDNLALYWNTHDRLKEFSSDEWLDFISGSIARSNSVPGMKYILQPINSKMQMKINTKPGVDMNIPRFFLNLVMEELGLNLCKSQYYSMMQILESFERMTRNEPFRKYRPLVPLKESRKLWWEYAFTCILEEDVRRRFRMWSWSHIKQHRDLCRKYKEKYKERLKKMTSSKTSLADINDMEMKLNVVSIVIFRQMALNEIAREKKSPEKKKSSGWFSSFFSSSKSDINIDKANAKIKELIPEKQRKEEMQKLYSAIGYSENEVITPFAKEYVALKFYFHLKKISISLQEDSKRTQVVEVMKFILEDLFADVHQRPSANAIKVSAKVDKMLLFGTPKDDYIPVMVRSVQRESGSNEYLALVNATFETNPLQKPNVDQLVKAFVQPVEIVYDADTVDQMLNFFKPPQDVILQNLQDKAYSTFQELKTNSTAGLLYAMDHHSVTDVEISMKASYFILPEGGNYKSCKSMLITDFGSLKLDSDPDQERVINIKDVDESEVQNKCYDRYLISLSSLQILLCCKDEDWNNSRFVEYSPLHILSPLSFHGKLAKALVPDDARLSQIVLNGTLSGVELTLTDAKISMLFKLGMSIPIPNLASEEVYTNEEGNSKLSIGQVGAVDLAAPLEIYDDLDFDNDGDDDDSESYKTPPDTPITNIITSTGPEFTEDIANQVKLDLDFKIKTIKLDIGRLNRYGGTLPCLSFHIDDIESRIKFCRWDMVVDAAIRRMVLSELGEDPNSPPIQLLSTPENIQLLKVTYRQCFFNGMIALGPQWILSSEAHRAMIHYRDEFQSTEQVLYVNFAMVYVILQQEALLRVMDLFSRISHSLQSEESVAQMKSISSMADTVGSGRSTDTMKKKTSKMTASADEIVKANALKMKLGVTNELLIRITAKMEGVDLQICSSKRDLAKAYFKGLSSEVEVTDSKTQIHAKMKDLKVIDCSEDTIYKQIIFMDNEEVFDLEVVMFNDATGGENVENMNAVDMSLKLMIGRMKAVYLHRFIMELLVFLDNFQISQETAERARQAAYDSTVVAVKTMRQHGARNKLNITIQAPLIIVPVDSVTDLCLMVDLGQLKIFNKFCLIKTKPKTAGAHFQPAITDNMAIYLTDLKLSKTLVKDGTNVIAQRLLVDPITLNLNLIRSLSTWNHNVPDIEVKGSLKSVKLSASEDDLRAIMEVLDRNMKEGFEIWEKDQKQKRKLQESKDEDSDSESVIKEVVDANVADGTPMVGEAPDEVWLQTKFTIEMENVVAAIYSKPDDMLDGEEFLDRDPSHCLGIFIVGHLGVVGNMLSDSSMAVSVVLDTLTLDDKRPGRDGVTRMIEYHRSWDVAPVSKHGDQPQLSKGAMVEIQYEMNQQLDTTIDIRIQNLLTILNVEFIMVLTNIFLNAMPKPLPEDEAEKPSLPPTPTHSVAIDDKTAKSALISGGQVSMATDKAPLEHVPEMKVTVDVKNPQIVILADAQNKNTNALFLHTLLNMTYVEKTGQQLIYGAVSDTTIVSAAFQKERRKETSSQVLFMSSLSLYSTAPIGGKPHVNISTTVLHTSLSPATIHTVAACLKVVTEQQMEKDEDNNCKDLSRLWDFEDIRNSKKWYLETTDVNKLTPGSMVWARTRNGYYEHGFLSQKDTHFNVYFYPKGEIKHSVKDNTSVILDKKPDEKKIRVGLNVIFANAEKGKFEPGRIKQLWEKKDGGRVVESGWEDVEKGIDKAQYLVKSYMDGKEYWKSSSGIRLMPRLNVDGPCGVGALVFVRMKNGSYCQGRVKALRDFRCHVFVFSIQETIQYDVDDATSVVLAFHPRHSYIQRGKRVICFRLKGKQYHPGRIQLVQRQANEPVYVVKFDDGESSGVLIDQMVLLPKPNTDMVPGVGTFIFARNASEVTRYEKAVVNEKSLKKVTVKYLNGQKTSFNIRQFDCVIWNVEPNPADLRVGSLVIASDDDSGREQIMMLGRLREIKTNARKKTTYVVDRFDGKSIVVTLSKLRIVPEGDETDGSTTEDDKTVRKEQLIIEVEGINFKIEGYLGGQLTPLLCLDSRVQANIRNWSSNICMNISMTLEASYFNEKVAEWEPLIEPVTSEHSQRPMGFDLSYLTYDDISPGNEFETEEQKEDDEEESFNIQDPMTALKVDSKDPMEVTLTKTSLGILQNLGQVFSQAVYSEETSPSEILSTKSSFVVYNMLGKNVCIQAGVVLQLENKENQVVLEHSQSINLSYKEQYSAEFGASGRVSKFAKLPVPTISVKVDGYHEISDIAVKRHRSVMHDIIPSNLLAGPGTNYSIIIDVDASEGQKIITIRSPLQVHNHFPMPVDISYENKSKQIKFMSSIQGDSIFSVPLAVAYHTRLFAKPAGFGYENTTEGILWSQLRDGKTQKLFTCNGESTLPFYIQVVSEEQDYTSSTSALERFAPKYTLHLYPTVIIHNYLPSGILYRAKGMHNFEPLKGGENWPLFSVNISENPSIALKINDYLGKDWKGSFVLQKQEDSKDSTKQIKLTKSDSSDSSDCLWIGSYIKDTGSHHVTLYSPYWIMNKTGLTLTYQANGEHRAYKHDGSLSQAFMMMIQGSNKKMKVCVNSCEWSSEFSVDTVGSDGSIKSIGKHDKAYEIGVGISLSYFSLTKIVTLTPLHMLTNHTQHLISLAEADAKIAEFHHIVPGESVPFWPTVLPPRNLYININGHESVKFNPVPVTTLLLKMQNEIGGVCASYQQKDSASILSFSSYFEGAAPVRIENYCPNISMVSYKQSDVEKVYVLCYGQSVLYTWDEPMNSHELVCSFIEPKSTTETIPLEKNGFGRMSADDKPVYWVSFLDGLQRVLLFTEDFKLAYKASQEQTLRPTQDISMNLRSIGISLVDVSKKLDIAYIGIQKSNVLWEEQRHKRWKSMSNRLSSALEDGYQRVKNQQSISPHANGKTTISDLEIDFDKMMITKPTKIRIRRTYHSGLSLQYIVSPNLMQFHAKINSIQIDSHVPGSTFPTVLHPVEPPKSMVAENAPKPFCEMSLTTKVTKNQFVNEISYFKVLVQEMDVRVDKGFLMALIDLFTSEETRGKEIDQYQWDMETAQRSLAESPEFQAAQNDARYFFDYFHLSPLKIHVSFSMTGGHSIQDSNQSHGAPVLNLLFQSVGVAFTEVQDVEFRLACFEVDSSLLSQQQLLDVVLKHYQRQAIKQLYVLVFGLDVLGNPFGLISGITTGAKNFFYEPYQGLIQGPEEFAQGLALGVKSLVGGTVGGAAGAVSRITGTVGKGLAALTLDDEYQQKRRQQMSQKPTNLGQGLAKGGKSFVKGIFSGVTGIVTKPVEGAKNEGAAGFFKGVGKGLIGVVARPTGGLVDMASSTFEGLKSTAGGRKQVSVLRLTRVFHADKILRPYIYYEAAGNKILMEAEKGRFMKTDSYYAHAVVDSKTFLFVTDKKVILIGKGDLLDDWVSKWQIPFTSFRTDVECHDSTVVFKLHSSDVKKSFFSKEMSERREALQSEGIAKWFVEKVNEARCL